MRGSLRVVSVKVKRRNTRLAGRRNDFCCILRAGNFLTFHVMKEKLSLGPAPGSPNVAVGKHTEMREFASRM